MMNRQDSGTTRRIRSFSAGILSAGLLAGLMLMNAGMAEAQEEEKIDFAKISVGKSFYRVWSRSCHGGTGVRDGPMAEHLRVASSDLTLVSQRSGGHFYFERVTKKIDGREKVSGHDSKDMPVWSEAFQVVKEAGGEEAVREKITALAHYLRSIQATADVRATAE